jgi:hypothetical protein
MHCEWKQGPLPPNTWDWGAVIPLGTAGGFYFADFHGDHVVTVPGGDRLEPNEVSYYTNDIKLPNHLGHNVTGRKE